jgi:hypothetical protein
MKGDRSGAISKVVAILVAALLVIHCQGNMAPTCKEVSAEAISAYTAAAVCIGALGSVKGGPPIPDLDDCIAKHGRALPLVDAAERACQSRSDVLNEIATARKQIQEGKERLELAKDM